jgi:hypothetical protein
MLTIETHFPNWRSSYNTRVLACQTWRKQRLSQRMFSIYALAVLLDEPPEVLSARSAAETLKRFHLLTKC